MRTIVFSFRAIVPEDFPREQIEAMSLAATVQIQEPEDLPNPERVYVEQWALLDGPSEGVEVEDLGGFYEGFQASLLAPLFGAMVRRSRLVVESYHGDLFHDADWLRDHVHGATSFYWAPRTFGANIGTDPKLVGHGYGGSHDEMHFYRVDVGQRIRDGKPSGMWQATFTRCDPAKCEDLTPTEDAPLSEGRGTASVLIHLNIKVEASDTEAAEDLARAYLRGHNIPVDDIAAVEPQ